MILTQPPFLFCIVMNALFFEASNLLVKSNLPDPHPLFISFYIKYPFIRFFNTQYFLSVEAQKSYDQDNSHLLLFSTTCCNKTILHFSYRTLYVIVLLLFMILKAIQTILQKVAEIFHTKHRVKNVT